jgi:crossover junction endodeoxyribonuclease RuvC
MSGANRTATVDASRRFLGGNRRFLDAALSLCVASVRAVRTCSYSMTRVAIDPGLSGGIAYQRDGQPPQAVPMPGTEGDLVDLLRAIAAESEEVVAIVEEVGGYIGKAQPGSTAFKFGRNFGFILGVLQTIGIRVELVRPQKWQKALSLGSASGCASKTQWKNKLKASAQRLYSHLKPTLATADALLILDYARRMAPAASPRQEARISK